MDSTSTTHDSQFPPVCEQMRPLTLEELKQSIHEHEIADFWLKLLTTVERLYGKGRAARARLSFKLDDDNDREDGVYVDTVEVCPASGGGILTYDYRADGWAETHSDADPTTLLEGLDAHIRTFYEGGSPQREVVNQREAYVEEYLEEQNYFLTRLGIVLVIWVKIRTQILHYSRTC